jgi:hypothetical protein
MANTQFYILEVTSMATEREKMMTGTIIGLVGALVLSSVRHGIELAKFEERAERAERNVRLVVDRMRHEQKKESDAKATKLET